MISSNQKDSGKSMSLVKSKGKLEVSPLEHQEEKIGSKIAVPQKIANVKSFFEMLLGLRNFST